MRCVLAHCLGVEELTWRQRSNATSCSGSFFYPELAGRRGRHPAGWQPALADAGATDRPVNFDDIEAFELRNAGRVEVFVFVWQQTLWTDGLEYYYLKPKKEMFYMRFEERFLKKTPMGAALSFLARSC